MSRNEMFMLREILVRWIGRSGEFFSHLGAKWTCIEDTAKDSNEAVPHNLNDFQFTSPNHRVYCRMQNYRPTYFCS